MESMESIESGSGKGLSVNVFFQSMTSARLVARTNKRKIKATSSYDGMNDLTGILEGSALSLHQVMFFVCGI